MSVRVMTEVWEHSTHGGTELLVLLKLADHADDEHRLSWPSVGYLSKRCRVGERAIQYALASLRASGEIAVAKPSTFNKPTVYRIDVGRGVNLTPGASAIGKWAHDDAPESSVEPSIRTLTCSSAPGDADEVSTPHDTSEVRELFDYWREKCGHPNAKPSPVRLRKVRARLREGYTVADVRRGIDGAAVSPARSDDGSRVFDDLELICRDGVKLESFMGRAAAAAHDEHDAWAERFAQYTRRQAERDSTGTAERTSA